MFKSHLKPRTFVRLFSTDNKPNNTRKLLLGTGITICTGALSYMYFNSKPSLGESALAQLPHVQNVLPLETVHHILHRNEESLKPNHTIIRMDLNSVASNNPCEDYHSESYFKDGYIIGIFDGHGGPQCGELVMKHMASYVAHHLSKGNSNQDERKKFIVSALKEAFVSLDNDIINGALTSEPDSVHSSWNPFRSNQTSYTSIIKNLKNASSGSCAIVAYIEGDDIYVASAGDCRAVLGRKRNYVHEGYNMYEAIELSRDHVTKNPEEYARLMDEHPGEEDTVIRRGRVLGGLMPTRALGDARYKWSLGVQEVVIPHIYPDGKRRIPQHFKTPPYVTALPDVVHYKRDSSDSFLILACDGLWDDLGSSTSVNLVGKLMDEKFSGNYSTALIQSALSGMEYTGIPYKPERIHHHLSIPAPQCRRYRDDMTVNVIFFDGVEPIGNNLNSTTDIKPSQSPKLQKWIQQLKGIKTFGSKL